MTILDIKTPRVFLPLLENKRFKGARGGRGGGKSYFFAGLGIEEALAWPGMTGEGYRFLCYREIQKTLEQSAKFLLEKTLHQHGLGEADGFKVYNNVIKTPKDGVIDFIGLQDHTKESVKSYEGFHRAWGEEAQTITAKSLEMLIPTIRWEDKSRGLISQHWHSWNPRLASDAIDQMYRPQNIDDDMVVVTSNWRDNPWFPEVLNKDRLKDKQTNPDRYGHIWEGEYEPMAVGAIWSRQTIEDTRIHEAPELTRIVVGVDPAVTDTETSDMHGIVVDALGVDGHGYCLADMSMKGQPREWAVAAVAAYDMFEADAIVIEVNQGGDMVKHTLNSVRPGLRIIEVRATRGKHVRAEPISALYSLGRFHHVGTHLELENQMCLTTAEGYAGEGSPDRLDAHVWAATELFPRITRRPASQEKQFWTPPVQGGWMGA